MVLEDFLSRRRVSELQEMWGFWQNGRRAPTRKSELLDALHASLHDEGIVRSRIKVLSERPRQVLVRLVRCDGYRAALPQLVHSGNGADIEPYEVEAAARALAKRGFLEVTRDRSASRGGHETYVMPHDLGELITELLREERRGPREVFSLAGFLGSLTPGQAARVLDRAGAAAPPEAGPEERAEALLLAAGDADPFASVTEPDLARALRHVALRRGGIVPKAELDAELGREAPLESRRLRGLLEELGLGTVTNLNLQDYGLDLGGESVVLFAETVARALDLARRGGPPEHERVGTARVDLLTDLQQLLHLVATTPIRVTQGRSIYRAAQHRILESFIFTQDGLMDRETVFGLVYNLAFTLELVEVTDESRLRLTRKGEAWDTVDLTDKVRAIYDRFLEERLPEGADFHVRRLRRALSAAVAETRPGEMLPVDDVPFRVRNDYLAALEGQGVRDQYRNRFRFTYTPPRQSPWELHRGLCDYVLSRLYPLGVVDVAMEGPRPIGIRLTELGRKLLLGHRLAGAESAPRAAPCSPAQDGATPLVVNPDFEVILFPEGEVNEIAHRLDRFAARTKSEEVAHYRLSRESVERAVVKGMAAEEILDFLDRHARVPVPQNVSYSIREWANRVAFASQREVVLLTTIDAESLDRVLTIEDIRRLVVERLSPTAVALRARITDWKLLESLRTLGVYFK